GGSSVARTATADWWHRYVGREIGAALARRAWLLTPVVVPVSPVTDWPSLHHGSRQVRWPPPHALAQHTVRRAQSPLAPRTLPYPTVRWSITCTENVKPVASLLPGPGHALPPWASVALCVPAPISRVAAKVIASSPRHTCPYAFCVMF